MVEVNKVLQQVVQIQERGGFSDQYMADKLGCSRPLYQRTRTGKIPVGGRFLKGALRLLEAEYPKGRAATVKRNTQETSVELHLDVDGSGTWDVETGIFILDHLLSQFAKHGVMNLTVKASGDDTHHIVEDVAICLGKAFADAMAERRGIPRMASMTVPMDEALVTVAVDVAGRGYPVVDLALTSQDISGMGGDLVRHFLESFAIEARIALHVITLRGQNDHHKAEAAFKALGRVIDIATRIDDRISSEVSSTKGIPEK